jgi:predicted transcriptional regulator
MEKSKRFDTDLVGRLFPETPHFRIAVLGRDDARRDSHDQQTLRRLLLENEAKYPMIERWYGEKVLPGMKDRLRVAYVAFLDETPVASAVLKLGNHAKFCHLRVREGFQDRDLGQMFFTLMTFEAKRHIARDIHFTLPESLWSERSSFFTSFGFTAAVKAERQYRSGEDELACAAPISVVWANAISRVSRLLGQFSIGGFSSSNTLLFSMKPDYAERVFAGRKQVEIRRKFSEKWLGSKAVIYGTQPLGALMGEVTVSGVTSGSPGVIWERFGGRAGCSHEEFNGYVGDAPEVYAIELNEAKPYLCPLSTYEIAKIIDVDELRPPQSFLELKMEQDSPWARAISVVGLSHGRFRAKGLDRNAPSSPK